MYKKYKSFFKTVSGNEGEKCLYPTRLDTYGCGCQHDCKYCYAKSLLEFRGFWRPNNPSVSDISEVKEVVKNKLKKGDIVRLGGMTDCFMPLELKLRNTYKTIEILNEYGIGYLIVTKSHIVANTEYLKLMNKKLAHIQITYTCSNDKWSPKLEKASLPSQRINAIEKLQDNGFDVTLRLSPFIPQLIDLNILNTVKCDKILIEFLRVNESIKKLLKFDYTNWTIKQSGYYHLPLEKKIECLKGITGFKEMSVCEDETKAYNYWKENFNYNKSDCCNLRI